MADSHCSHTHRTTGVFDADLSRNVEGSTLYTTQISASICADCGRILDLYCKSPATVCAWLESELPPQPCPRA